jgi:endonuclease/exonuclease/phosphatase family metal-dependent hydrolase
METGNASAPPVGDPSDGDDPATISIATWNLHAGIDGWGRPFDVIDACRRIDADVLVLEECWAPADPDRSGTAASVARALGYAVVEEPLAGGRRAGPHPRADRRWMRPFDWRGSAHALYLDGHRPLPSRVARSARFAAAEPGSWGIAVLSRRPIVAHRTIELGRLGRDRARRVAVVVELATGAGSDGLPGAVTDAGPDEAPSRLTVIGTHMSHLSYGSPVQFARLRRMLESRAGDPAPVMTDGPAVLTGDMNLWGPAVAVLLRGWRRTVKGRTWPAWRPHSQVDHVLVRGPVDVIDGAVLPDVGSDHRPVRVTVRAGRSPEPTPR